jgi:hypothetical protein
MTGWKPVASARSEYAPGNTKRNRKFPISSAVERRVSLVLMLVNVMEAFGTTAPVESVTVPKISPLLFCASIGAGLTALSTRTVSTVTKKGRETLMFSFISPSSIMPRTYDLQRC